MNWVVIAAVAAAELLFGRLLRGALYTLPALWAWPALDVDWAVTFALQAAAVIVFASFLEVRAPLRGSSRGGPTARALLTGWPTCLVAPPRARCRKPSSRL